MKSKHSNFAGKPPNIALEFGKKWSGKPGKVREFHCCDKLRTLLYRGQFSDIVSKYID